MSTPRWEDRSSEQARLLNPAFLSVLLWSCAREYEKVDPQGLPYALAFIAMPVVLHKQTREGLPRTTRTSLATWIGENPQIHIGFADRAQALVPVVREAILFGCAAGLITLNGVCLRAVSRPRGMSAFEGNATAEVKSAVSRASFLGKWFARGGTYTTVMALWGVAP